MPGPPGAPSSAALTWCGPSGAPGTRAQEATISPVAASTHSPTPRTHRGRDAGAGSAPLLLPLTRLERQPGPRVESLQGQPSRGRLTPQRDPGPGGGNTARGLQRPRGHLTTAPPSHQTQAPCRGHGETPGELESCRPQWRQKRLHAQLLPAAITDKEALQSLRAPSTTFAG